jgi:hypothetical protein
MQLFTVEKIMFHGHKNLWILHCCNVDNYSGQIVRTEWPFYLEVDLDMSHLLEVRYFIIDDITLAATDI